MTDEKRRLNRLAFEIREGRPVKPSHPHHWHREGSGQDWAYVPVFDLPPACGPQHAPKCTATPEETYVDFLGNAERALELVPNVLNQLPKGTVFTLAYEGGKDGAEWHAAFEPREGGREFTVHPGREASRVIVLACVHAMHGKVLPE